MRTPQLFVVALSLAGVFYVGFALKRAFDKTRQAARRSWPMLASERLAVEGVEARYRAFEDALAPVTTDASLRRAIVSYLAPRIRAADAANREVLESVRRRLGLADGTAFVASIDPTTGASEWVAPVTSGQ